MDSLAGLQKGFPSLPQIGNSSVKVGGTPVPLGAAEVVVVDDAAAVVEARWAVPEDVDVEEPGAVGAAISTVVVLPSLRVLAIKAAVGVVEEDESDSEPE